MIGKTNAQTSAGGGIKGEKVNISLKTNQSSHDDLKGAIITVSYATVVEEYTWNGNTITVEIPPYVDYSVYTSGVEGYATPSSYSSTSVPENSKSVDLEYKTEVVSVTLSTDDGSSVKGASVTINGKSYTWNGTAITQKVAFGTSYTVSVGEMSGLSQPSAQTFTANQASREVSFVYIRSTLVVNILSNQSGDREIGSIKATVSYGSTSVQVSSGEKINIPVGSQTITITFPDRNGWKKPSTIRFSNTSGGEVVKSGTYQTEIVYVSTYSDEGGITGFTTTVKKVDGTVLGTSSASMLICEVPSGTQYIVSCSDVDGYIKPAEQIFTASSDTDARRNVSMVYEIVKDETLTVNVSASDGSSVDGQVVTVKQQGIANGVYIEDINGKLWTEAEWNGSVTPNGVAVITDECQFVMALEDVDAQYWAPNYSGVPGAFLTNFLETAKTDYSGIVNTQKVVEKFSSDTGTAAYCCQNFIFPNGGKGYVGAVGEWQAVINNKDAIFSALSKCGAEEMVQTSSYWTSTMETAGRAWLGSLKNKTFTTALVLEDYPVRAFTKLGSKPVTNGKVTFAIPNGATYEVSVSEKEGYVTPASQTFTASGGNRTVSMQYVYHHGTKNPTNGVWIQDVDGYCHTADTWDKANTPYTPNGIAVVSDNCSFVIALDYIQNGNESYIWGTNKLFSNVGNATSVSYAILDYNGKSNTENILTDSNQEAALYCSQYIFPNGKNGYLGAAGEWRVLIDNKSAIEKCISAIGKGQGIYNNTATWTSTQRGADKAWYALPLSSGTIADYARTQEFGLRPFTTL